MQNHTGTAEVKTFIDQYIDRITIYPKYVEVTYTVAFSTAQKVYPVLEITVVATRGEISGNHKRSDRFSVVADKNHLKRVSTRIVLKERPY